MAAAGADFLGGPPRCLAHPGSLPSAQAAGTKPPYTYDARLPFNALQQLTYFGLVFVLTPFQIITGLGQSPSILGRFPWFERSFGKGGRQTARSLHFLGLVLFGGFLIIHL